MALEDPAREDPARSESVSDGGGFSVTVLGCSGTYAGPGNACSGYLLRSPGATVWLDAGPGTLANVQQHVSLPDLDALVLSHEHPDHWLELPVFRNALKWAFDARDFPVYGTAGAGELARQLIAGRAGGGLDATLDWHTIGPGDGVQIGDQRFRFALTDHPVVTLACRVEVAGRTLVYSADTGPEIDPAGLMPDGEPVDLAIIEATGVSDVHLTGEQAGHLATTIGARRLVITHLLPGCDAEVRRAEVATAYGGPVDVASVHATFDI